MVAVVVQAGILAVVVGIGMTMYRMLKGPHIADRVLAGDVLSLQVVALVILLAVDQRRAVSLDVALMVAIVGFASTLGCGRMNDSRIAVRVLVLPHAANFHATTARAGR